MSAALHWQEAGFTPPVPYTKEVRLQQLGKSQAIAEAEAQQRLERDRQEHARRLARGLSRQLKGKVKSASELASNDFDRRCQIPN
jgi:hypothetical protein